MLVGVTGPTGAGKTRVSKILEKFGFIHIDVDKVAGKIINADEECKAKIRSFFGEEVILNSGKINKKILGAYAFENKNNLYKLNKIVQPYIFNGVKNLISLYAEEEKIVIDAAVLIESKIEKLCDYVIFVNAPKEIRIKRIIKRDKIYEQEAIKRVEAQNGDGFYLERADFVLENSSNNNKMIAIIENIINKIGGLSGKNEE